jgi:thymidylate synthase ThyX
MSYDVQILADSICDYPRLTTMQVTFPRYVLAEFNTHRVFSRNSASSRAIPVATMLERVEQAPFVPFYWGKNQKGMQADEELDDKTISEAERQWRAAADDAAYRARALMNIGVHKQITNRLLEPFLWHTVIVTATEWENFFNLRCHPDASPELRNAAVLMREVYESHVPRELKQGEWHLPLWHGEDVEESKRGELRTGGGYYGLLCKRQDFKGVPAAAWISAARCARVSYLTHDGVRDTTADIDLATRLLKAGHMSPFEHPAVAFADLKYQFNGNFRGWTQLRKCIKGEEVFRP